MPTLFAMFSTWDITVIALLALLFFGNRLPGMMRSLGEGITEFKKGMNGEERDEEEEDLRSRKQPPRKLDDRSQIDDRGRLDDSVADSDANVRKFDEVRKQA